MTLIEQSKRLRHAAEQIEYLGHRIDEMGGNDALDRLLMVFVHAHLKSKVEDLNELLKAMEETRDEMRERAPA